MGSILHPQRRIGEPALFDEIIHNLVVVHHLVQTVELAILHLLIHFTPHRIDRLNRDHRDVWIFHGVGMVRLILENHLKKYRVVDTRRSSEDDAALGERLGHTGHKMLQVTVTPLVQAFLRHVLEAPRSPGEKVPQGAFHHHHVRELLPLHVHDAHDLLVQFLATGHLAMFHHGKGMVPERRLEITIHAHPGVSAKAYGEIPLLVYAVQPVELLTVSPT
mmetsp:Transcript_101530/g.275943  ORF Transcript_101530/g.275943 Transcript_101530/m.275943 type:complete len:219 (-) Transcript_101530:269-925(-)